MYYPESYVLKRGYTEGKEYIVASTKEEYKGNYIKLKNGKIYSFKKGSNNVVDKLLDIYINFVSINNNNNSNDEEKTNNSIYYNLINKEIKDILKFNQPISFYPQISPDDINKGYIKRYFIRRKNDTLSTIMEIDANQFNEIGSSNKGGIDNNLYDSIMLDWYISGNIENIIQMNIDTIKNSNVKFEGINKLLNNPYELVNIF